MLEGGDTNGTFWRREVFRFRCREEAGVLDAAPRLERRAGCWAVTTRLRLGFLSAAGVVKASSRERRCEGQEDITTN